ncbi:MAG: T9SS type A sorting domain-containing protein [Melioribacteraceae bacterium]|nr:T9SS type A sorting domain-containing protein [Melioribacteraceae bacterium]
MRKFFLSFITAMFCLTSFSFGQNIVNVSTDINAISTAVTNAVAGDILVLQRDSVYLFEGRLDVAVPITIRASEGEGERPLLQQIPNETGAYTGDPYIQIVADLTVENIHFNGSRGELRTIATGRAIRFGADDLSLIVDGCAFERFWLRTIDLNTFLIKKVVYKNSLHLWDGREDRIDNGRFIDTRGSSVDSLIVVNNTFLNCNDRIIRNMGLPGILNYVKFDHNTFYGNIGYRPAFQFRTTKELVFTNNVVANVGLLGTDTNSNRTDEIDYSEPFAICVFTVTGTDTLNTTIDMKNNVVFTESRFTDLFAANPDSVQQAPWFNKQWEDRINLSEAVSNEELTFGKAPSLDSLVAEIANYIAGGTNWSNTGFITRTEVLAPADVDMSYGTTAAAYTGAENGFPVGDLNWYPELKTLWEAGGTVDVEQISNVIPERYSLEQNYPNPFNPTTNIIFNLPESGFVTVKIFNAIGQEVATLVNEELSAGQKSITFNAQNLTSGLYFYQLNASQYSETKKMIILK